MTTVANDKLLSERRSACKARNKCALYAVLPLTKAAASRPPPLQLASEIFEELQKGCFLVLSFFLFWFYFQIKHKYLQEPDTRKRNMKIMCACAEYHDIRERKASVRRNMN